MKSLLRRSLLIGLPILIFLAGWWFGLPSSPSELSHADQESSTVWTCSMHPQIRQPEPGLCPICNMDLIPLRDEVRGGLRELTVSPEAAALLDLRVSPVVRAPAEAEVRLFGRIDYDERRISTITARAGGRLDRLFVDFTGAQVRKGDHLAEIYSPDLLVAQRELIEARRAYETSGADAPAARETRRRWLDASREKLRLLQFSDTQIAAIESATQPSDHLTLYAPQSGIVTDKFATEGQYIKTGDPLFKVADLSQVWLRLEAYERDLQWLRYAQDIVFTVEALPGRTFHGRIAFIDPEIDPMRRVARVRVNVDNPDLTLKPGMFAEAIAKSDTAADGRVLDPSLAGKWISPMHPEIVKDGPGQCDICGMDLVPAEQLGFVPNTAQAQEPLLIPTSAVLLTGERAIVYLRRNSSPEEGPTFEGREIVLGPRVGDHYLVEDGLEAGDLVVTRGAFKLDSELQIKARPSMMNPNAGLEEHPAGTASAELSGAWTPIPRHLDRLLRHPDPAGLAALRHLVQDLDPATLPTSEQALWQEFSRRLLNQLTLASREISQRPTAATQRIASAIEDAGRHLGLPYAPEPAPTADPTALAELRVALDAYFPLAKALAEDDDTSSRDAAQNFAQAAPSLSSSSLTAATDLSTRRSAFKEISAALITRIRETGLDAVGNAYVVHCPMAFGNSGADWLSDQPTVHNPYFGDAMLSCGSVTETLSVAPRPEGR
ncbi:Cu(I)/Ag(I) efflux system membrane fusion protein [Haloferula luteola]|uniref:Cu(I)/Ag(I) efflux system membrane fusion protein n=1 Tax=Haloferula luteola TaxID=595692 RepID=A0A840V690_9BACT|nr:efflux RND transporter periplasmic adaptor subunit [Haloferula luteola]MBB5353777.1 Cu(I)/Ag(I) efflux system membrane fusion protein [Haloferula luteola]